jgi:hypothetical protein
VFLRLKKSGERDYARIVDGNGRPIRAEWWPGATADVTTPPPVVDRLRQRFSIGRVCVVADRA